MHASPASPTPRPQHPFTLTAHQVLLFTNKEGSTTLYKALSTTLRASLAFAEVGCLTGWALTGAQAGDMGVREERACMHLATRVCAGWGAGRGQP